MSTVGGDFAPYGLVAFLFGVFCAYWAQETGRSAWLWFFLGLLLPPIAGIALLSKNAVRLERLARTLKDKA
ncbi:hypothetical protein QFW77_03500 [Luteimonas sp. RD2P54]|uniref:Uncharacterized protein n=1 Tax=Luteimonas endophytica TaxID=3042023 RepID=A0ABT6J5F2_9GAMM|nr:hypothetical protein [Luteimonas endophytica]MDH5822059.1 hypothetical protein [Luteimonas endophytica]